MELKYKERVEEEKKKDKFKKVKLRWLKRVRNFRIKKKRKKYIE